MVTLIPFDAVCELGRIEIEGTTVVALDQVIPGRLAEQADIVSGIDNTAKAERLRA